jgi:hypothetical protein
MIYVRSFINIGSGEGKGKAQTFRRFGDLISLFLFFLNKENKQNPRLKMPNSVNIRLQIPFLVIM